MPNADTTSKVVDIELSPWSSYHIRWMVDTGTRLRTADGTSVAVFEFRHENDEAVLSAWAKHYRNHYCLDADIDTLRAPGQTRKEYLTDIKFPSRDSKLGPSIRAGDFGEILVADYLQWTLGCDVPRVRWSAKVVRDESPKGSDVIGFKYFREGQTSVRDTLHIYEVKTRFSDARGSGRLQEALDGSAKDTIRIVESLNYMKQRMLERRQLTEAKRVERFQSPVDVPYTSRYGAAVVATTEYFPDAQVTVADAANHSHKDQLAVLIIRGPHMMDLVRELYRRAADEA